MPSPMYPGGPDVDEVLAYREVVAGEPFSVFRSSTEQVGIEPVQADLAAVHVAYMPDDADVILHGQMAVERPGRDREVIVPAFMEDYDRVVTPVHDEIDAMSDDERFDLKFLAARAVHRVTETGRRTLSAFALFFTSDERQYGGLFVPEPMMGDSSISRELAPLIAARLLPRVDEVNQGW